jgi:hypothetical protein
LNSISSLAIETLEISTEQQQKSHPDGGSPMTKHPNPSCVVKVGGGRGFVIEHRICVNIPDFGAVQSRKRSYSVKSRLVVTAAHCLPHLPLAQSFENLMDRTYPDILRSLDGAKSNVWSECLFADPVADIAVLGCPDEQDFDEQADAYHALTDDVPALAIAKARRGQGWLLAIDGVRWIPTTIRVVSDIYGTSLSIGPTVSGMSGSPILDDVGRAVGVVAMGTETVSTSGERHINEEAGPQPILMHDLPARIVRVRGK